MTSDRSKSQMTQREAEQLGKFIGQRLALKVYLDIVDDIGIRCATTEATFIREGVLVPTSHKLAEGIE